MRSIREGLEKWEQAATGAIGVGDDGSGPSLSVRSGGRSSELQEADVEPGRGVAGESRPSRSQAGLAWEMDRPVRLIAVTPTKQVLQSSVGREVS